MIILTDAERKHFIAYLLQEAATFDGITQQMLKDGTHDSMLKPRRTKVSHYLMVADYLSSWKRGEIEAKRR